MILRWIQTDARSKKLPADASLSASLAGSRSAASENESNAITLATQRNGMIPDAELHDMGESEFNAIFEEVCDTVMPRKPAKKPLPHRLNAASQGNPAGGQDTPWNTLFHKLGEETAASLGAAIAQLQEMALLHPNIAPAIANVSDQLEHAHRAALIAQQFTQLRSAHEFDHTEELSLRQIVSDAISLRARWLHRRKVKARLGLLDAQIHTHPSVLNCLLDELINWAGSIAHDIGFAVREPSELKPTAQLLVIARVNTESIEPAQWQNLDWYLWHQLAASLGASVELQITQEALSVTIDFSAPTAPNSVQPSLGYDDSSLDADIGTVLAGCRVLLLLGHSGLHEQAHRVVSRMGLRVSACASVAQAHALLSLDTGVPQRPLPHAIVYDTSVPMHEMTDLRQQLQERYPERKIAFVELSEHVGSDFHVSQMGDASTAHVSLTNISNSLSPALIFELCKVI